MKERFNHFFEGRQGMDEMSKGLFWTGLVFFVLSLLMGGFLGFLGVLLRTIALMMFIYCFIRAFSRNRTQRDAENYMYLSWMAGRRQKYAAYKDRRSQHKEYRFFKCPGCGAYLRVPKGKGKVHIKCKCGYTLYRRT